MFDYLTDSLSQPKVLFLNCQLKKETLFVDFGFLAMGISKDIVDLFDDKGSFIISVKLPDKAIKLPFDVALPLNQETFIICK